MVGITSMLTVVLVLGLLTTILLGLRTAARLAGIAPDEARKIIVRGGACVGAWLGLLALLTASGVLTNFEARPPRMLLVVVFSVAFGAFLTTRSTFARLLHAMPRSWPVAIQTMRIPIELGLWILFLVQRMPEHLTFEGRNYDIIVGVSAPFVAFAIARGKLGPRAVVAWNLVSLGLLVNIVGMAATTLPGPLHLPWPGTANTIVAEFPYVWLPGFLVPVALFSHVTSLRQWLARGRTLRPVSP
jgi:hypothetical protein